MPGEVNSRTPTVRSMCTLAYRFSADAECYLVRSTPLKTVRFLQQRVRLVELFCAKRTPRFRVARVPQIHFERQSCVRNEGEKLNVKTDGFHLIAGIHGDRTISKTRSRGETRVHKVYSTYPSAFKSTRFKHVFAVTVMFGQGFDASCPSRVQSLNVFSRNPDYGLRVPRDAV